MAEITLQDLAVMSARIEAKQDEMMKQLENLARTSDQHWKRINEIETKLALLEQRQGPKVHPTVWVLAVVAVLGFVASFVTFVVN